MPKAQHRFSISGRKKLLIIACSVLLFLSVLLLAFLFLNPDYAPSPQTMADIQDWVTHQQRVEKDIQAAYQAGNYTFDSPLVIQDPYQFAPLTALVIFDTPQASRISVHVPGKDPESAVDFTFPSYVEHHEIPIYGLYAGTLNQVTLSMQEQSGVAARTSLDLQTEPLPDTIPAMQVLKVDRSRYSPGMNFTSLDNKPVYDIDGNVRWYSSHPSYPVLTNLENGRFLFTYSAVSDAEYASIILEQDLLGRIYAVYNRADGVHHEICLLPNGNFLIATSDLKSSTVEDQMVEVDRKTGHIVRSFDLRTIFDPGRQTIEGMSPHDWLHLNSIAYDSTDQSIIISSFSQSAVVKLTYPGMQIKWILGVPDNWDEKFQPYLLEPVGENFEWPGSQHHVTLYGVDTSGDDLIDILMFDNGLYQNFNFDTANHTAELHSMVSHYQINEKARTVSLVWEYGRENGNSMFSGTYGSAYLLPDGNVLGTWGDIYTDPNGKPALSLGTAYEGSTKTEILEVVPSDLQGRQSGDDVVYSALLPGISTYRVFRSTLYAGVTEASFRLSERVNDTAGNDLIDRSEMAVRDFKRWLSPVKTFLKQLNRQVYHAIQK